MRIYINEIKVKDDGIYCFSEDPTDGLEVGQMLVDSDNYGFAYLLDDGESYSYLIFVQEHGHCYMKIEIRRLSSITI